MAEEDQTELLYKVLVVGDVGVGKTSLVKQYAHGIWAPNYKATLGVDFSLKEIFDVGLNTTIRVQLWDIAGQERYKNLTRVYYNKAVAAVVVFDASNPASLAGAVEWLHDLEHKVVLPDDTSIPCVLMANKIDLSNAVSRTASEAQRLCEKHGFKSYFEVSAKTGKNVDKSMNWLVQYVYNHNLAAGTKNPENQPSLAERGILSTSRDAIPQKNRRKDSGCC